MIGSRLFWKLIGANQPAVNSDRRKEFKKAFQRLWVAGTLGAFFFAFARNLPVHLREIAWPPEPDYTIDRFPVQPGFLGDILDRQASAAPSV